MVHVSNTMWRVKYQPSNFTSCGDNALYTLVGACGGKIQIVSKISSDIFIFSIWSCVLKECFERGIFWKAKSCLKGIEDFNLEHWLQSSSSGIRLKWIYTKTREKACLYRPAYVIGVNKQKNWLVSSQIAIARNIVKEAC
jgi:hypothetical protein